MFKFLKQIILAAGDICRQEQAMLDSTRITYKAAKDLVTEVDRKVEMYLIDRICDRYPDHGIFGEETGRTNPGASYEWIIDPIDGTTSYVHRHPFYCVSVALLKKGQPVCSGVYAPVLDELYTADANAAFLNDRRITVSGTDELVKAVMATGFACLRSNLEHNNLRYFNRIVPELRDIRRFGSAALDLCYVAAGRLDGFWEMNLNVYDVAAGAFIVKQAGGIVTDFNGRHHYPKNGIVAANPMLHPQLAGFFKNSGTCHDTNGCAPLKGS